jgi:hypothetical protein
VQTAVKSLLLLTFTLVVGFALGLFADAMLVRGRRDRISRMGRPPGMVAHLERVIQPRDSVQAAAIRPILQHAVDGNEVIIRDANDKLRANMDSLRVTLAPSLDADQRARLERELRRLPRVGVPGPGGRGRGGPRGRRGPPDGPPPTMPGSSSTAAPSATRPPR